MIILRRKGRIVVRYRGLTVVAATVPAAVSTMNELVWGAA